MDRKMAPSTSRGYSSSSSDDESSYHELDYSHSEMDSFEITFSNFSRKDGNRIGRVSLAHNRLRVIPRKISVFKNIQYLDISGNNIESLSAEILTLTHLKILIAKNNRLTADGLPKDLYQLSELQQLNLGGNPLGRVPEVISVMKGLTYLHMGGCDIREIPKNINKLDRLETLYLGGNHLQQVPEELGFLDSLQALYLNDNQISVLPSTIANLSQLRALSLHKNRLSTLPGEIIKLDNLREVSLRENPLVRNFVRYLIFQPATLKEIVGRVIKSKSIPYVGVLPKNLTAYLSSAHQCVNNQCKGVYFDSRYEHIKFVDFCGKYKVPFLEYLCSPHCAPKSSSSSSAMDELPPCAQEVDMMKKVLLG